MQTSFHRLHVTLFTKCLKDQVIIILVYVDDLIIVGNYDQGIASVKSSLHSKFHIKDLGNLKYFLAIQFARVRSRIFVNQWKYVLEIFDDARLLDESQLNLSLSKIKVNF